MSDNKRNTVVMAAMFWVAAIIGAAGLLYQAAPFVMESETFNALVNLIFYSSYAYILWAWSGNKESPYFSIPFKLLSVLACVMTLMQIVILYKILFS